MNSEIEQMSQNFPDIRNLTLHLAFRH